MHLFDVYDLMELEPVRAKGSWLWDDKGEKYLDFYGGHAVISIGHSHPLYVERLTAQLDRMGFYSNSVRNTLQEQLAERLGKISGCENYALFLCNSGAEANENALKVASFVTGRDKIAAFRGAFHGRTSAAVAATDNPAIQAPLNCRHRVTFLPFNDPEALEKELAAGEYAAVVVEGIQGVGGIRVAEEAFLRRMRSCCTAVGTLMILDEIQSGYGRSGKFFAHQYAGVQPDIITTAKGMGNGFPIGGVLLGEAIAAKKGMLGTTFGGNHLACAAALAVLEVLERECVLNNAAAWGNYLMEKLTEMDGVRELRGRGLMIGVDTAFPQSEVRALLAQKHRVLIGYSGKNTLRLLPSLTITAAEADVFLKAFAATLHELKTRGGEQ